VRIPILQTTDINDSRATEAIAGLNPDLLVCVGFSRLFSQGLLDVAAVGCINAHPSALPKWRGPAPIFWQLKEGLEHLPVTIHWLDAKEDHGPILARGSAQVFPGMAGDDVYRAGGECAGRLLKPLLESMVLKVPAGEEQVGIPGARAKRPVAADATISNPESWSCQHLLNFITGASWFTQCSLLLGDDVFELERGVKVFLGQRMPAQFMVVGEEITVQCKDGLAVFKLVDPG
jgi:methionyl-tRNA formyltransferase